MVVTVLCVPVCGVVYVIVATDMGVDSDKILCARYIYMYMYIHFIVLGGTVVHPPYCDTLCGGYIPITVVVHNVGVSTMILSGWRSFMLQVWFEELLKPCESSPLCRIYQPL